MAAVQLRNVLERRGELALLRAVGFRRSTLARFVLLEHTVVLVAGLGIGLAAAAIAVLPHLLDRGAPLPWACWRARLSPCWPWGWRSADWPFKRCFAPFARVPSGGRCLKAVN